MTNDNIEEINNYERHQMHEERYHILYINSLRLSVRP
jgi:hypothetical protein